MASGRCIRPDTTRDAIFEASAPPPMDSNSHCQIHDFREKPVRRHNFAPPFHGLRAFYRLHLHGLKMLSAIRNTILRRRETSLHF